MSGGKVIIIVGARGTGKSTVLKELLSKVPNKESIFLFDVNHEHLEYGNRAFDNFDSFIKKAVALERSVIVIEEATIFLSHYKQREVLELLVRARHTKNNIIFVFHSLRALPRYIYDLGNFLILKKTNDQETFVSGRFEDPVLDNMFSKVNEHSDRYYFKMVEYA